MGKTPKFVRTDYINAVYLCHARSGLKMLKILRGCHVLKLKKRAYNATILRG